MLGESLKILKEVITTYSQNSWTLDHDFMDEEYHLHNTCVYRHARYNVSIWYTYLWLHKENDRIYYSTHRQPHSNISRVVPTI